MLIALLLVLRWMEEILHHLHTLFRVHIQATTPHPLFNIDDRSLGAVQDLCHRNDLYKRVFLAMLRKGRGVKLHNIRCKRCKISPSTVVLLELVLVCTATNTDHSSSSSSCSSSSSSRRRAVAVAVAVAAGVGVGRVGVGVGAVQVVVAVVVAVVVMVVQQQQ